MSSLFYTEGHERLRRVVLYRLQLIAGERIAFCQRVAAGAEDQLAPYDELMTRLARVDPKGAAHLRHDVMGEGSERILSRY